MIMEDNIYKFTMECPVHRQLGFLYPHDDTRNTLPDNSDLNRQINLIANNLPILIREKILREEINRLDGEFNQAPDLTLAGRREKYNAIFILVILAQAYIWEDADAPAHSLPALLAKNLYVLCKHLQRLPVMTYADYVLSNWRLLDKNEEISLANIEPLVTITGSKDEAWFIKIHIVIEALCAKALYASARITTIADEKEVYSLLNDITQAVISAAAILKKMPEGCHPSYYWRSLRNYLNGWEKVRHPLKNEYGVTFAGINIRGKAPRYQLKGASGAQSSILPALDAALGIQHDIDEMYQTMLTFRQYMPREHVLFIDMLSYQNAMKERTKSSSLQMTWEAATAATALFRREHINLVKQYIYQPAEYDGVNAAAVSGTGGTAIDEYLGNRYSNSNLIFNA